MPKVAVIMGSVKDSKWVEDAVKVLEQFGVDYEVKVLSAHRTPEALKKYVEDFEKDGGKIIVALAGYAAHLAGVIAAYTVLPVIAVPLATSPLLGFDSLLAMVQMPKGVPVATVAVNGAANGALLAVEMLALSEKGLKEKLLSYRRRMAEEVLEANKC
ncbi:5-(carboxyamino)imidazole ribonucleotide mutase [Thermosulfidibacter takaii ABI70S6]|uniref:N5-carboxyaminoimidazole ribonucleotide mutase n=1 Tax=Thermosulfidibacter takaii (strain DSM 17441 / JCM 13301 / NBRC 103674 / ABI70S6) TaxID=1298851 RepID=A0A0S3QTW1_THET7|nr:5-(carboxyamino)imidazole ribonucleotide mutase [Thermosulfidibacter takaii]BAT71771.1 5-(carboxyamino)imidazole ribonucleotide mutase [Thermosulfidibacter takaii ABI70S6]